MTEPDEALLWAREDLAKKFEPFKPYISEKIRNGDWDNDAAMRASVIGYRAGAASSAERIKELEARIAELEAALVKANTPRWFYGDEEGSPFHSLDEAIEGFCESLEPGWHFLEVETARPCKTIWGVVRLLTEDEAEARGDDEPWVFTPCATEAEARALLKETDR